MDEMKTPATAFIEIDQDDDENFRIDGQYFIAPGAVHDMVRGESKL